MKPAPAIATWLLERTCSDAQYESVTGDLLEQYQLGRSRFWYWWQVLLIVSVRICRNPLRCRRVPQVRRPATRMIAPLSFFLIVLLVTTDTAVPDTIPILLFGIFFSFIGLKIVRLWYNLHPQIQALNLANRERAGAAPYPPVVQRPLGLNR